jgi:hypothetical protein
MFFFRKLFGLFFLGLLLFGVLGFFGRSGQHRTQEAYQQGFMAGQQAAAASSETKAEGAQETMTTVPHRTPGANVYFRGHGFFFPSFGLLFCLVPLFMIGLLFTFGGKRRWHKHGHHPGHWGRGPCGPGRWGPHDGGEESAKEKSPEDIDDSQDEPVMRV